MDPITLPFSRQVPPLEGAGSSRSWRGVVLGALLLVLGWVAGDAAAATFSTAAELKAVGLRTEHLVNPTGIETPDPRLSWWLESSERGKAQSAYQILVATTRESLSRDVGDQWNSGKVESTETTDIVYSGVGLKSGQHVFWKVKVWDEQGRESRWSEPASWIMGLLDPGDWKADWISFRDRTPVHADREKLLLPPARHYRKEFRSEKRVRRATLHYTAFGLVEMHVNGRRVGDAFFEPGWSDYTRRVYHRTQDVTALLQRGGNCLGAIVAEGWYAGYVGYGLLVGYGPNKSGRNFYGKTPSLLAQLTIEYGDGTSETVGTDTTWEVSGDGPVREADLIMGESFDARRESRSWCLYGGRARRGDPIERWKWEPAIRAGMNGAVMATFHDTRGAREVDLGFQPPFRIAGYAAPPIRVTGEVKAVRMTEPRRGVYVFDLGQNIAGVVRLKVNAPAGTKVQIRHGEMVHPDGTLMTENLRRARATDYYIARGAWGGETWVPRFTYHGFQYVELTGLMDRPGLDAVTGLVLHNDTPLVGEFECSDEVMTRFWRNTLWTQRGNFVEIPTDCPQRDERLGWMGDAQIYARTATFNADVAGFFTKWLQDVTESQLESGAYPDYAPYPMSHGGPGATWGTAWTDAGIIVPWTMWHVYGDTRLVENQWESMTRFMAWRQGRAPDLRGRGDGNGWGDWLNVNEQTPLELIDAAFFKWDARLMSEMAGAIEREAESVQYRKLEERIAAQFARDYHLGGGRLKVDTQTAYVLALAFGLLPEEDRAAAAGRLAEKIVANGHRMATGFLGTKSLLAALSDHGRHDLAVRLYQSRKFPSWGYEVVNGATTVWERWDSFTREHGFEGASGKNNASMNSFSHYAFGAVNEWAFRHLAGIDTDGPGYRHIVIRPRPPDPAGNPDVPPVSHVRAAYRSPRGPIVSSWRREADGFRLDVVIPANTTATVHLPAAAIEEVTEGGLPVAESLGILEVGLDPGSVVLLVASGEYQFVVRPAVRE